MKCRGGSRTAPYLTRNLASEYDFFGFWKDHCDPLLFTFYSTKAGEPKDAGCEKRTDGDG